MDERCLTGYPAVDQSATQQKTRTAKSIMADLKYLDPLSRQTLRQGIRELIETEGADGDVQEWVAPDLAEKIDVHDAIHVLFACPTDLRGEIDAHVWTIFGTTMSFSDMHAVNRHSDHKQVLREIGHVTLIKTWVRAIPGLVSIMLRAHRMSARWPVERFRDYLEVPLADIRQAYGIRLSPVRRAIKKRGGAGLRQVTRSVA